MRSPRLGERHIPYYCSTVKHGSNSVVCESDLEDIEVRQRVAALAMPRKRAALSCIELKPSSRFHTLTPTAQLLSSDYY